MYTEAELIPISALQHWVFCPRQCGLIHLEGLWTENRLTAEGRLLHEKAHEMAGQRQGQVRIERGLDLHSLTLGLVGKADVVEFNREQQLWRPFPVEYKRGKPKGHDADRLQLCAQAVCLEEMLKCQVPCGALFYGRNRRREPVEFSAELRAEVARVTAQVRTMLQSGRTPSARNGPFCRSCSLLSVCLPGRTATANSASLHLRRQMRALLEDP